MDTTKLGVDLFSNSAQMCSKVVTISSRKEYDFHKMLYHCISPSIGNFSYYFLSTLYFYLNLGKAGRWYRTTS